MSVPRLRFIPSQLSMGRIKKNAVADTTTKDMTTTLNHTDSMYTANTDIKDMSHHNHNTDSNSATCTSIHTLPKTNNHTRVNTTSTYELCMHMGDCELRRTIDYMIIKSNNA